MQTPRSMDKIVIEDYYHMITMHEYVNWTELAHLLPNFPLTPKDPFCTSIFTSTFVIAFLNVHTREKQYLSLM